MEMHCEASVSLEHDWSAPVTASAFNHQFSSSTHQPLGNCDFNITIFRSSNHSALFLIPVKMLHNRVCFVWLWNGRHSTHHGTELKTSFEPFKVREITGQPITIRGKGTAQHAHFEILVSHIKSVIYCFSKARLPAPCDMEITMATPPPNLIGSSVFFFIQSYLMYRPSTSPQPIKRERLDVMSTDHHLSLIRVIQTQQ